MTGEQERRLLLAAEKLADAFAVLADVSRKRLELEFPAPGEVEDAEVYRAGEARQEPQSPEEYEEFAGDGPGRFETLLAKAKAQAP
jgi:hypothetical protein